MRSDPQTGSLGDKKGHALAQAKDSYKWVALSNTTLGVLMASLNANIILISLPAIFRGIKMNPMAPSGATYLLWMLMGYTVVTATLLVSFGRISDIFGRVRLYNLGFAIFTLASVLLFLTPGSGNAGATEIIIFRLLQGVGAGFLFSNSTAILTDAFPPSQRGMAMGLNQIFGIGGSLLGLIVGGLLADLHWRLVFLVSVPVGLAGTFWAYFKLKETGKLTAHEKIDWLGNGTFAVGLTVLLLALTYGIMPYGQAKMGWGSPFVQAGIVIGIIFLAAFIYIELHTKVPMFRLDLFRIRAFAAGNLSLFLSSIARGGLTFMLIIWLQGIWLPLHGYNFEQTPLWAGIYMLPMMIGFFIMGPLSGYLSDRYGARGLASFGMLLSALAFILLTLLPANFSYLPFVVILLIQGFGMGMFAAPNTTAIMNTVPAEQRGVSSGMRSTLQNTGMALSMTLYFTLLIFGMIQHLPVAMYQGLIHVGVPAAVARQTANLPPTGALFAAFLGYNPMASLLPPQVLHSLPAASQQLIVGKIFFPQLIAPAVMSSLRVAFYISAALSFIAAIASYLRGKRTEAVR
ncbi:Major facilitator superfamily transporter [Acididesulfobacillus acetoxydans]|uniref:Major facilitator super MFS 1 n=1 Tax=Acididesulfobacillus acetoxydans TaxID=1561005 RepID=A0A8S0XXB1_9FIRM|nr:MFS transporter [Acididesulfobacillus acetoxydans]CAA7601607.1 Major facilitator superfamily transporter [Acididesulfobacillus acetoxydans]CEJ07094.1 Major facilitator super MFS 1 [Acididesulfobacillus acetoxydans]